MMGRAARQLGLIVLDRSSVLPPPGAPPSVERPPRRTMREVYRHAQERIAILRPAEAAFVHAQQRSGACGCEDCQRTAAIASSTVKRLRDMLDAAKTLAASDDGSGERPVTRPDEPDADAIDEPAGPRRFRPRRW